MRSAPRVACVLLSLSLLLAACESDKTETSSPPTTGPGDTTDASNAADLGGGSEDGVSQTSDASTPAATPDCAQIDSFDGSCEFPEGTRCDNVGSWAYCECLNGEWACVEAGDSDLGAAGQDAGDVTSDEDSEASDPGPEDVMSSDAGPSDDAGSGSDDVPTFTGSCMTSADCPSGDFCDFPDDDCGVWGNPGVCTALPQFCIDGGPGVCGCSGVYALNGCKVQEAGTDVNVYGGCEPVGGDGFSCGESVCNAFLSYCNVALNDVAGAGQPLFSANCVDATECTGAPSCACITVSAPSFCVVLGGWPFVFSPGG